VSRIEVHPATPDRWDDVVAVAGEAGFSGGCWCMWWRWTNADANASRPGDARAALEQLVADGREPGLIAYRDRAPVGWVAVAPRDEYRRIARTKALQPVDHRPAWAVPCVFVARGHRGTGVADALVAAAARYATDHGADLVEGYPVDPSTSKRSGARLGTGRLPAFERAGFVEVARRGDRPIVRFG
jgi:GNAT superfamily N-acetyltransferase